MDENKEKRILSPFTYEELQKDIDKRVSRLKAPVVAELMEIEEAEAILVLAFRESLENPEDLERFINDTAVKVSSLNISPPLLGEVFEKLSKIFNKNLNK